MLRARREVMRNYSSTSCTTKIDPIKGCSYCCLNMLLSQARLRLKCSIAACLADPTASSRHRREDKATPTPSHPSTPKPQGRACRDGPQAHQIFIHPWSVRVGLELLSILHDPSVASMRLHEDRLSQGREVKLPRLCSSLLLDRTSKLAPRLIVRVAASGRGDQGRYRSGGPVCYYVQLLSRSRCFVAVAVRSPPCKSFQV